MHTYSKKKIWKDSKCHDQVKVDSFLSPTINFNKHTNNNPAMECIIAHKKNQGIYRASIDPWVNPSGMLSCGCYDILFFFWLPLYYKIVYNQDVDGLKTTCLFYIFSLSRPVIFFFVFIYVIRLVTSNYCYMFHFFYYEKRYKTLHVKISQAHTENTRMFYKIVAVELFCYVNSKVIEKIAVNRFFLWLINKNCKIYSIHKQHKSGLSQELKDFKTFLGRIRCIF